MRAHRIRRYGARAMRSFVLFTALLAAGCQCGHPGPGGTGGGGGSGNAPMSITVTPADATYTTDGISPVMAPYMATAKYADGHSEDITTKATFSLDDIGLGQFMGNTFKSVTNRGGKGNVSAILDGVTGKTTLTLVYQSVIKDPASTMLPADVDTRFGGMTDMARAPDIVYPNDGVLLPPNLGKLEVHFLPGTGNTLFQLSIASTYTNVKIYLGCTTPLNGGCVYVPDATAWSALATANRGGDPVTLTLKGTGAMMGSTVGVSSPTSLSFSNDDIQGGLYYWTTTTKAIMRWDFGSATQTTPDKVIDAATVGGGTNCIGCHALSPDGQKMVVEAEGSTDGRIALFNVSNLMQTTAFPAPNKSFFESWNAESTQFVGVDDRDTDFNLRIIDGTTGMLVQSIAGTGDMAHATDHPSWAADGNTIAYAHVERNGPRAVSLQWPTHGAIAAVKKSGATWGTAFDIAPAIDGKNRYYPAIAPSSDFLVFDESTCSGGGNADLDCDGDTDKTATMFAATLSAGATLIPLTKANGPGKRDMGATALTNSFPKWSPFNFQRTQELGSKLQWLTFSSGRKYGLRDPRPNSGDTTVWLWMVAIDPDKVAQGVDPSYPAFCLPFQDLSTSNHIPQWTQVVVPIIQ
jgi:hypothetical protein